MTNKKKILFITPDYMDYTSILFARITEYTNADTYLVTTTGKKLKFTYRNSFHRIQNFFFKLILNKNQKKLFYYNAIGESLETIFNKQKDFDEVFILRPDLIKEHLPLIKNHSKRLVAYFWDSFSRIPAGIETIPFFDRFYSFEPNDVQNHQLQFLPNFYYEDLPSEIFAEPQFDIFYIATYDKRFKQLKALLDTLKPLHLKTNIQLLANPKIISKNRHDRNINWMNAPLPLSAAQQAAMNSKVLLDIAQPNQEGLSFRFFEAMQLNRKIITTNSAIVGYDFYKPENIFIWQNKNTIPPKEFFTTPYSPPVNTVIEKYSLRHWIKSIFE